MMQAQATFFGSTFGRNAGEDDDQVAGWPRLSEVDQNDHGDDGHEDGEGEGPVFVPSTSAPSTSAPSPSAQRPGALRRPKEKVKLADERPGQAVEPKKALKEEQMESPDVKPVARASSAVRPPAVEEGNWLRMDVPPGNFGHQINHLGQAIRPRAEQQRPAPVPPPPPPNNEPVTVIPAEEE
ncbi:unnamed protein product [Durusdinium trenchii]|uniref:Uncharacterized protein n=1 Tax=Durusdinium trenchii TaxID=1381693 RepID=A0ABP0MS06_9DINO